MPTHPSSPFSHAYTRIHHQPDSSPPGLAQWACYIKASAYGSRVGWTPARTIHTYIHTHTCIFSDFTSLARKRLFTPPRLGLLGIWPHNCGGILMKHSKGTSLGEKTSNDVQIVKISPLMWPVRVTKRPKKERKKDKERNLTVANWVFAKTTRIVGSKWNFARWVVFRR